MQGLPVILIWHSLQSLDKPLDIFIEFKFCDSDFYFLNGSKNCIVATYNFGSVYISANYCGNVPDISNGYIESSTGSVYGGVVIYRCYPDSIIIINPNYHLCHFYISANYCGNVPEISNGYIESSTGSVYGGVVIYRCYPGSNIIGNSQISCHSNGQWDPAPSCQSKL